MRCRRSIALIVLLLFWSSLKAQTPNWSVDATQYEHSMFITAIVIDGELNEFRDENSQVAAFVNGEVRGVASFSYEAAVDRHFAYLLIHGNTSEESVSFKAYDAVEDLQFDLIETVAFMIDGTVGDLNNPKELLSTSLSGDTDLLSFGITDVIHETSISGREVSVELKQQVDVSELTASFSALEGATVTVDGAVQVSEVTILDFTSPVTYDVRSANRLNTESYTITVTTGPFPEISSLDDLTVDEGDAFEVLDLDDFETVYVASEVVWEVSNTGELNVTLDENNHLAIATPDENWFGSDTLSLTVTHGDYADLKDSAGIVLTVNNVNDAPVFDSSSGTSVFLDSLYNYTIAVADIDSESLTIDLLTGPDWLNVNFDGASGQIFGVPRAIGSYTVGLTVSDGAAITQQNFTILVSDRVIDLKEGLFETIEGSAFDTVFLSSLVLETGLTNLVYSVSGNDQLTYQLSGDTLLVKTPTSDFSGSEVWNLEVRSTSDDLALGMTNLSFTVANVNDVPKITSDPVASGIVNSLYQYNLTANDIDGDQLTLITENLPSWIKIIESENFWVLSGIPETVGTYPVTIVVSDGSQSASQLFTIVIGEGNSGDPEPIRVITIPDQVIDEGKPFSSLDLSDFLINRDSGSVSWSVIRASDELNVNLTGALLQVEPPNVDWYGSETITIVSSDISNPAIKVEQVVLYAVRGLNDAPIIASTPVLEIMSGEYYEYNIKVNDVDGDVQDFSSSSFPDWMRLITTNQGAILFGDHVDNGEGQFTVSLTVTDGVVITRQVFDVQVIEVPLQADLNSRPKVNVFPNPASTSLSIAASIGYEQAELISLNGKSLGVWSLSSTEHSVISLGGVKKGMYFLHLSGEHNSTTQKIMVQ